MLPILQVGSISLRTPGLALLTGLWLALEITSREGKRHSLDENQVYNIGFGAIVAGVLGARLGYILLNYNTYLNIRPLSRMITSALALAPGTEIVWFGLLAAAGWIAFWIRRQKIEPLALADSFAPGFAIFAAGTAAANLLSGDYYGVETDVLWAIDLWGAKRHPTQIYFLLASLGIFVVLWRMRLGGPLPGEKSGKAKTRSRENQQTHVQSGLIAQVFVILISLAMMLVEPLRADSPVIFGGIRTWEVVALISMLTGLGSFAYRPPEFSKRSSST